MPDKKESSDLNVPATLLDAGAAGLWIAVVLTGIGAGIGAGLLTLVLEKVQALAWYARPGMTLLDAAQNAGPWRHVITLAAAGLLTGAGQWLLTFLSTGNGIDITAAIWFNAGRLPIVRTLGSAVLSIVIVGMGASLGREGAPKQVGAVIADLLSTFRRLSDEQRRLLVACGAGAGMAAAYSVPIGGAIFALEVLRGTLSLRLVIPALAAALIATGTVTFVIPNLPTYSIPAFEVSPAVLVWAVLVGPIFGLFSVLLVRAIAWADNIRPRDWLRFVAPVFVFSAVGVISIPFPQVLGNGKDITQVLFSGQIAPFVLISLLLLRPAATVLCFASGAPGGLFTPSLAAGALLGSTLGQLWLLIWPGAELGLFALIGAGATLAATTQGPVSAVILMMELTGEDRVFIVPMLIAVVLATLVSRTMEQRSIYEARLSNQDVADRVRAREPQGHRGVAKPAQGDPL